MAYLLDTNHCSELFAGNDEQLRRRAEQEDADEVCISATVAGELSYMCWNSERREENWERLERFLKTVRVVPVEVEVARYYGEVKAALWEKFGPKSKKDRRQREFKTIGFSENDIWIAAAAISCGAILVTADGHFSRIQQACQDLRVESWLSSPPPAPLR
ncbi:MAG TPA: type II toxin-antitoxin system VapC family toxin [Armatimonadota bacterium]|nr:type II toxin-antitoxin system VapC family toxin [Armatimonadota bacterium]